MPLREAIHHSSTTPIEQLHNMRNRLFVAFGWDPAEHLPSTEVTVAQLAASDVQAILNAASFGEVIEYIEHSHDNVFPVVDKDGLPTGVIRYSAISNAVFDPDAVDIVRADDLAEPLVNSVNSSDTASHVVELFNRVSDDCIVVTDPDNDGKFCGVVRRSDVMNMLIRGHASS